MGACVVLDNPLQLSYYRLDNPANLFSAIDLDIRSDYGSPAVYRDFDDFEQELLEQLRRLDFTFKGRARVRIRSQTLWEHQIARLEFIRSTSIPLLVLRSDTAAYATLNSRLVVKPEIVLAAESQSELTVPYRYTGIMPVGLRGHSSVTTFTPASVEFVQSNTLTLRGLATVKQYVPSFYRHGSSVDVLLETRSEVLYKQGVIRIPVVEPDVPPDEIETETYEHRSLGLMVLRAEGSAVLQEQAVTTSEHLVNPEIALRTETTYQLNAAVLNSLRFGARGSPGLRGSAQYAFIPFIPAVTGIHEDDEEVLIALASYLLRRG